MVEQFGKDIVITYKGADRLQAFKKDVQEVRNSLNGLVSKAGEMSKVSAALNKLTAKTLVETHKDLVRESQREVQALREQLQLAKTLTGEEIARERAMKAREDRVLSKRKKRLEIARLEARIEQERIAGINKLADREAKLAAAKKRFAETQKRAQEAEIRRTRRNTNATRQHVGAIQAAIGRTIRFFLLFRAVQEGIQLAGKSIRESLDFAALLEESQVQIAGLIVSVSDLKDEFGNTLDAASAMPVALGLSQDILSQLQKDAVLTASTFRELVENLQIAVAPGVSNGLDLDQVRQLTVTFSQAATALGLEQRQLAEEIRSTLQGTITQRNTRIATALGITNEDIRQAKEAGQLYEFLEERMAGIAGAATLLQGSLSLLRSNFFDLLQIAGATGIQPVFKQLKGLFGDLIELFDEGTLNDGIQLEPGVVDTMQLAAEGLAAIVESFREFLQTDDAADTMKSLAIALRSMGEGIAESLPGLLAAAAAGVKSLATAADIAVRFIAALNPGVIAFSVALLALLPAVKGTVLVVGLLVSSLQAAWAAIAGLLTAGAIGGLAAALPILAAAVLAVVVVFGDFNRGLTDVEKRARKSIKAMESFKATQERVAAASVSVSGRLVEQANAFEDLAKKIREAVAAQEIRGRTDVEKFQSSVFQEAERVREEAIQNRNAAEERYAEAVKESREQLESVPSVIRKIAVAQRERDAAEAKLASEKGQADGPTKETIEERTRAVRKYYDTLKEAAFQRRSDDIAELAEKKRIERFERAAAIRDGADPKDALGRELKTQEGLDAATQLQRLRNDAAREIDTSFAEYFDQLAREAEAAATALADRAKKHAEIAASREREQKALEAQIKAEDELLRLVAQRAGFLAEGSIEDSGKLKREIDLKERLLALDQDDPQRDVLRLENDLYEKRLPLMKQGVELEKLFNLALEIGGDKQREALDRIGEARRALSEQLSLLDRMGDLERERLRVVQGRADLEAGQALEALQRQLREAQELTGSSAATGAARLAADAQIILANTAAERREASLAALETERQISEQAISDLELKKALLEVEYGLLLPSEKRANIGLKIDETNRSINEELDNSRRIKIDLIDLERKHREETELRAGLARGLQDAADQRSLGTEFQQVGTTFAESLGSGIREALASGDTDGAIEAFGLKMEAAILDALINSFIVAPISAGLSKLFGGGNAAEDAAAIRAAASLGTLQLAAEFASSALLNLSTTAATSSVATAIPVGGLDSGGPVPAPNLPRALPGHAPGDTTLIAAGQGEYVLNRNVSQALGHAFLNSVNSGMLSGAQARAAIAARIKRNNSPIQGFDSGGSVGPTSAEGVHYTGSGRRRDRGGRSVLFPITADSANTILSNPMLGPNLSANKAALGLSDREYI